MAFFSFFRRKKVFSLDEISARITPVAERYGVSKIWVFGSYADGSATADSDVDLLIDFGKVTGLDVGALYLDLKDVLDKEIDIVSLHSKSDFVQMISKKAVEIYG